MCNWKFVQTDLKLKFREIHACTHTSNTGTRVCVHNVPAQCTCTISTTDVQKIDDNKL
jgi:hypothetical protein